MRDGGIPAAPGRISRRRQLCNGPAAFPDRPSFISARFKVPPVQPWKAAADLAVNGPQIALPVCANRVSDIRKRLAPAFSGDNIEPWA